MKTVTTIVLSIITLLLITASVFLTIDGNLAKLTGWYRVTPGMSLFTKEHVEQLDEVSWMRLTDLHDTIQCEKDSSGTWWIITPFKDKLDPRVAEYIVAFAKSTTIIDTLTPDDKTQANMRDFGLTSDFCAVVLKKPSGEEHTTVARFKLGKAAPWIATSPDGKSPIPTTYLQSDYYGNDERVHVVSGNITPLFRNGLKNMRDPMPLRIDPNELTHISIKTAEGETIELDLDDQKKLWLLKTEHNTSVAEQESAAKLVVMLCSLSADEVKPIEDVQLDKQSLVYTITTTSGKDQKKNVLQIYKTDGVGYAAIVNDRDVVFSLKAAPKSRRSGGFASIVSGVYSLPVLPAEQMAALRGLNDIYVDDLPLTQDSLRSRKLAAFDERDVEGILIRSTNSSYPLRLQLAAGIKESNLQDSWTVEAEGKAPIEAETEIVRNFLRAFTQVPVESVVTDLPAATDEASGELRRALIRQYGLNAPDYRIFIKPRSCGYRSYLYDVDLPLVKDRDIKIFNVRIHYNELTGKSERLAMEENGHAIYRISHRLSRHFALQQNAWKARNLLSFHISELKRFTLGYHQAPLVLEYESIAESWSGTLGGVDVTADINPHRAINCVDRLRKIKVKEWLDPYDQDALSKLESPVFSLKVDLETVDHSEVDAIVADSEEYGHDELKDDGSYRKDGAAAVLDDESQLGDQFRDQAFGVRPVKEISYTIEIVPVNNYDEKPLFYGRLKETGQLFLMTFEDAQSMGSSPLEGDIHIIGEE